MAGDLGVPFPLTPICFGLGDRHLWLIEAKKIKSSKKFFELTIKWRNGFS